MNKLKSNGVTLTKSLSTNKNKMNRWILKYLDSENF